MTGDCFEVCNGHTQLDILDALAYDPAPLSADDAEKVRAAIIADGKAHGGHVSRNRVRLALTDESGVLRVFHKHIGPQYYALRSEGLIEYSDDPLHIEVNNDSSKRGRNGGKISRGLRLTDKGWAS